jgi:hypothetical protein
MELSTIVCSDTHVDWLSGRVQSRWQIESQRGVGSILGLNPAFDFVLLLQELCTLKFLLAVEVPRFIIAVSFPDISSKPSVINAGCWIILAEK